MITRLKKSYRSIKKHLGEPNVSDWIYDNFYLIDRRYRALIKNKKALFHKRLSGLIYSCLEDCDFSPSPKKLISCINVEGKGFGYEALASVSDIVCACAIIRIGESLETNIGADMIPNAVKTLNSVADPEYGDIIKSTWAPERIVSSYEPDYERFSPETKDRYRKAIADIARKSGKSEMQTAIDLTEKAKKDGCLVGDLLFKPDKKYAFL